MKWAEKYSCDEILLEFCNHAMEPSKLMNRHQIPAVRISKLKNGEQKPNSCTLARSSPVKKPSRVMTSKSKKADSANEHIILSNAFDETDQSLEDEIFEELEKVAHDEAKLNAALQNFDKILLEHCDKKTGLVKNEKLSAIPKPLQKSKTCIIIESKCILKNQEQKKKIITTKVEKLLSSEGSIASSNYYQAAKSLWNLQDFDTFSKSEDTQKPHALLGYRKSEGAFTGSLTKATSAWDFSTPTLTRPTYSRQTSISKIPIKSSKFSTSMLQLNACNNTSQQKLSMSRAFTSSVSLNQSPQKTTAVRRTSLRSESNNVESFSPKFVKKYAETKASIQRRNMIASTIPVVSKTAISTKAFTASPLKSSKSEMPVNDQFASKAADKQQQLMKLKVGHGIIHQNRAQTKVKLPEDLLNKSLLKGQELLRKTAKINDSNRVNDASKNDTEKRDYVSKYKQAYSTVKALNIKSGSTTLNSTTKTTLETNAIRSHQQLQNESENAAPASNTLTEKARTVKKSNCTLDSCDIITVKKSKGDKDKDSIYTDCDDSDDSGHISNENEDCTTKNDIENPRKISEELLEIFERKSEQKLLLDFNHVNLVKSSIVIYPKPTVMMCKSEVTFFINSY